MDDGRRPDFTNNESWFYIKILAASQKDNHKEMNKRSYTEAIRRIFRYLEIIASHYGHWGRVNAPPDLEKEEVPPEIIRIMGSWDPKTQDSRYSSKLPVMGLRVMAGFAKDERYFLPRSRVSPPTKLQLMIFPWIEEELSKLREATIADGNERPTAVCTLRFWKALRVIILQDMATMAIHHPGRKSSPLFELPVFKSEEFKVSFFFTIEIG